MFLFFLNIFIIALQTQWSQVCAAIERPDMVDDEPEEPGAEVVVAGERDNGQVRAALRRLGATFAPNAVVHLRPNGDAPIVALAPYLAGQTSEGDGATLYLCRDFACQAPTDDIEALCGELVGR